MKARFLKHQQHEWKGIHLERRISYKMPSSPPGWHAIFFGVFGDLELKVRIFPLLEGGASQYDVYIYIHIGIIFGLIVVTSHDRIHQNDLISWYLELVKFISKNHHPDICMETCVACMCNYGMTWAPKKVAEEGKSPYFTNIYLGEIS